MPVVRMLEPIEDGMRLADAAKLVPGRDGKPVQVATVKRWITHGCRGVKLRGWKIGSAWYTSREALEEFQRACTPESALPMTRTPAQTRKAVIAALKSLKSRGFKLTIPTE